MTTMQKIEYKRLKRKRDKNTSAFKIMVKKINKSVKENNLSDLAILNIKGGPKDTSSKMDSYLYN